GRMRQAARALNPRLGKPFADFLPQPFLVIRLIAAARDEASHRIEQFQPVFHWRLGDGLPHIKALFALEEFPFAPDVLRIDLQLLAVIGHALPTDFGLGHGSVHSPQFRVHGRESSRRTMLQLWTVDSRLWTHNGKSTLATAIAAMPSSRPM